jgi:hypothetical protein
MIDFALSYFTFAKELGNDVKLVLAFDAFALFALQSDPTASTSSRNL